MSRILDLPLLADVDVSGSETVPLVKDGVTKRALMTALLGPYMAEFRALVDTVNYDVPDRLMEFVDGDGLIFGEVGLDAAWDILLSTVRAAGFEIFEYEITGEAPPLILVDANNDILWEAPLASVGDASAEVATARGDRTSLDARLSQTLDAHGNLLQGFGAQRLRRFHYKRRKRLLGESAQLAIGLLGDSFTHLRTRWSGDFATTLVAELGDGGVGYVSAGFSGGSAPPYAHGGTQPGSINASARSGFTPSFSGSWTSAYATVPTPDTCCAISSTAGDQIRFPFVSTPVMSGADLFWIGTADGVIRYSWNGGSSWTSLNVQGTVDACSFAALTGVPSSGTGNLTVEVVSGSCKIGGVNFKSAADGVIVHKLAATGSRMEQLATQAAVASWRAAIGQLGLDEAIVMHATNDQGKSPPRTGTEFATDTGTVVTGLRTAIAGIDILLMAPPENQRGLATSMTVYARAMAAKAAELGTAFYDQQGNFGDALNPTEYGSGGATPLFDVDNLHPLATTGGRALVDGALRFHSLA